MTPIRAPDPNTLDMFSAAEAKASVPEPIRLVAAIPSHDITYTYGGYEGDPERLSKRSFGQFLNWRMASDIIGWACTTIDAKEHTRRTDLLAAWFDQELTRFCVDIADFHTKFGLVYDGDPRTLPEDLASFRIKFMQEELDEYAQAATAGDSVASRCDQLDALVDLVYVALGTAYLQGFNFAEAWRRVQRANMAKIRCERPEDSKRGSTFDIIKPSGWTAPDHSDMV